MNTERLESEQLLNPRRLEGLKSGGVVKRKERKYQTFAETDGNWVQ